MPSEVQPMVASSDPMVPLDVEVSLIRTSLMLMSIFMPFASRIWLPAVDTVDVGEMPRGELPQQQRSHTERCGGLILDLTRHRFCDLGVRDVTGIKLAADQPGNDKRSDNDADQQNGQRITKPTSLLFRRCRLVFRRGRPSRGRSRAGRAELGGRAPALPGGAWLAARSGAGRAPVGGD